jgi:hypothetical protein
MATEIPAATVDATKLVVSRSSIIQIKVGAATTVLLCEYVGDASQLEIGRAMATGADLTAYSLAAWPKSRVELFKFRSRELKKIITAFGSLTFFQDGTATMFIRSVKDAANKVALLSESDFACSIYRDPAEVAYAQDNPSEITMVIEAHKDGPVTLTPDGDTQAPA